MEQVQKNQANERLKVLIEQIRKVEWEKIDKCLREAFSDNNYHQACQCDICQTNDYKTCKGAKEFTKDTKFTVYERWENLEQLTVAQRELIRKHIIDKSRMPEIERLINDKTRGKSKQGFDQNR